MSELIARRSFLLGAGAALVAAPSIVSAASLMRIKPTEIIKPKITVVLPNPQVGDTIAVRSSGLMIELGVVTQQSWVFNKRDGVQGYTNVRFHRNSAYFSGEYCLPTETVVVIATKATRKRE